MNKTFYDILDDLNVYALTLTDERLEELEKDLNEVKPSEGTKKKNKFKESRNKLNKAISDFNEYKNTTQPRLIVKAKDLVVYFEKLEETGAGKSNAMAKLGELEALAKDVSLFDNDVLKEIRRASSISIHTKTHDHFNDSGNSERNKIVDKAIEVNRQIKDLSYQRIEEIANAFSVLEVEINQGIRSLTKTNKVLMEIVKALEIINKLLRIAERIVRIF